MPHIVGVDIVEIKKTKLLFVTIYIKLGFLQ